MLDLVWLAIAFPLLGATINGLFGKLINNKLTSGIIGCTALGLSFAVAVMTFFTYRGMSMEGDPFHVVTLWPWIHVGGLKVDAALMVDPLSITMMLFVTGISFLIHIYSTGYMSHDEGYSRFFTYLNLFVVMMLILVLGANGLVMFVGWEGVGLCSYLLIGFWYKDMFNANCGMKAFVVNRIGDFGILLGLFMVYTYFGTLDFASIIHNAKTVLGPQDGLIVFAMALFLFLGAMGKSAQVPLHIWLPDAMAGPTPVSALIHAATMVTAGVYLVARFNPVFAEHPSAGLVVATVGCATAFIAASIALTQNDIKKVLAYSTVSQLGYMFLAAGIGAYWVAIFHVITHAFFKACLFLGSGSVILGMHHEQDTRNMGGLAKYMPWTYATFLISTLAIAGIFPLAGFFSKDEILWKVAIWEKGVFAWTPQVLFGVALLTALMTAFYMGRVTWKTFLGKPRFTEEFKEKHKHPHESSAAMVMPLVVLAFLAVIGGFMLFTPAWLGGGHHALRDWLAPSVGITASAEQHGQSEMLLVASTEAAAHGATGGASHAEPFLSIPDQPVLTEIIYAMSSFLLAIVGLFMAWWVFIKNPGMTAGWKEKLKPLYKFSLNKWYFDETYHGLLVVPGVWMSHFMWKVFDVKILDGVVNGTAYVLGACGQLLRPLQTGFVRNYALYLLAGVVIYMLFNLIR